MQNPLSSLEDDVAATNLVLDKLDGPAILVGHSWGGAVISQSGVHPKVVGLVYVAAFQPDLGESALTWFSSMPPVPENGVLAPDEKGFVYYSKEKYHAGFCADLSENESEFMYASQGSFAGKSFATQIPLAFAAAEEKVHSPAWKTKPTWYIVAAQDKVINPDLERFNAKLIKANTIELNSSHVPMITQPMKVTDFIIGAAEKL